MSSPVSSSSGSTGSRQQPDHVHRHRIRPQYQRHRLLTDHGLRRGANQSAERPADLAQCAGFRLSAPSRARSSTLQATLTDLEDPSQLAGYDATVADKTIATATTTSGAAAGQYSLEVQNLATSATLTSQAFAGGASSAVGTGTLSIAVGGNSTSITIGSGNDTLSGIAAAINSAANNPGVTASVISTTAGCAPGADGYRDRRRQCHHRHGNGRRHGPVLAGLRSGEQRDQPHADPGGAERQLSPSTALPPPVRATW